MKYTRELHGNSMGTPKFPLKANSGNRAWDGWDDDFHSFPRILRTVTPGLVGPKKRILDPPTPTP